MVSKLNKVRYMRRPNSHMCKTSIDELSIQQSRGNISLSVTLVWDLPWCWAKLSRQKKAIPNPVPTNTILDINWCFASISMKFDRSNCRTTGSTFSQRLPHYQKKKRSPQWAHLHLFCAMYIFVNFSLNLHGSHHRPKSTPSFPHDWCPYSPKITFAAPPACFSHSWYLV